MSPVNSMDYGGKDTVLNVVRRESSDFFNLVDDPKNWKVQTRCTEWEVRDIVGHMIDVTEGYLTRWDKANKKDPLIPWACWSWAGISMTMPKHSANCRGQRRFRASRMIMQK